MTTTPASTKWKSGISHIGYVNLKKKSKKTKCVMNLKIKLNRRDGFNLENLLSLFPHFRGFHLIKIHSYIYYTKIYSLQRKTLR